MGGEILGSEYQDHLALRKPVSKKKRWAPFAPTVLKNRKVSEFAKHIFSAGKLERTGLFDQ
ncbi:MAG: hypothetical protein OSB69_20655, partial [Alphaproteobacteria bacterium]|nr:hypothetical protein [Alphaproteobacteria bacterium]